ncbi:efflux RND transporter periplasmic adaptor subunit [Dinghuibacter silviterrae]|uniref:RND family efflux transporter MFP subunit n=1 Tax=Dinghuibacter silviterrae TaxID=1539049 RepID=A0A4R8DHM6_9BACT|nr:efflux RND transporter periplasmic adaptor subunit [Dinghuibacter silviterrae]TDW96450.1 RND family efflux transporter MFP subunit [Dinghuibacter silviterrae]
MNMTLINSRLILGALLASGFLMDSCGSSSAKPDNDTTAAAPVVTNTFALQKGKLSTDFNVPGELIAYQQVDLYAKVNSFVKKLYVDIGSEVTTGQILATMEAPEITSQIDAASARVKAQESIFIASKANYDRMYETSLTPGTISQNDLDQAAARKNSDSAQLEAARSNLKEAVDTRDYLVLKAPFSGVISARNINPGAYVGPSGKGQDLPMFTLQQQSLLRLVVSVPELYTGYLSDKDIVKFTVKALPNQPFTARVRRLAGAIDNRLRSERIEMDVENPRNQLLPGMVAEVSVPLPSNDSTFLVPRTAVVNSTEKIFVIRANNGKAEWITVKTGREASGRIEVYGDLKEGDTLVTAASEEIRDGSALSNTKITPASK